MRTVHTVVRTRSGVLVAVPSDCILCWDTVWATTIRLHPNTPYVLKYIENNGVDFPTIMRYSIGVMAIMGQNPWCCRLYLVSTCISNYNGNTGVQALNSRNFSFDTIRELPDKVTFLYSTSWNEEFGHCRQSKYQLNLLLTNAAKNGRKIYLHCWRVRSWVSTDGSWHMVIFNSLCKSYLHRCDRQRGLRYIAG